MTSLGLVTSASEVSFGGSLVQAAPWASPMPISLAQQGANLLQPCNLPPPNLPEEPWLAEPRPGVGADGRVAVHLGVLPLQYYSLRSCQPLHAGLFLWLELLSNTSFIFKKMFGGFGFFFSSSKFLVG